MEEVRRERTGMEREREREKSEKWMIAGGRKRGRGRVEIR